MLFVSDKVAGRMRERCWGSSSLKYRDTLNPLQLSRSRQIWKKKKNCIHSIHLVPEWIQPKFILNSFVFSVYSTKLGQYYMSSECNSGSPCGSEVYLCSEWVIFTKDTAWGKQGKNKNGPYLPKYLSNNTTQKYWLRHPFSLRSPH